MKTEMRHIAALAAVLSMTACGNDPADESRADIRREMSLTCHILTPDETRTAVGSDGLQIVWSDGDAIGVYGADFANERFRLTSGVGSSVGVFSGAAASQPQYAYYPYRETAGERAEGIAVSVDREQNQRGQSPDIAANDLKIGTYRPETTNAYRFDYRQKLAMLLFIVDNLAGTELEGEALSKIVLTAPGRLLTGDFEADLTDPAAALTPVAANEDATLRFMHYPLLDHQVAGWMMIRPDVRQGDELTIAIHAGLKVATLHTTAAKDYREGYRYRMRIDVGAMAAAGRLIITADSTAETPLDVSGTSNCYIVSRAGRYSFDATVMGNGRERGVGRVATMCRVDESALGFWAGAAGDYTLAPDTAELLWQDRPGLIVRVDLDDNGRAVFHTGQDFESGNAVIAAKDAAGTILWSWHIWFSPTAFSVSDYRPLNDYTFMDRNLGATTAATDDPNAYGLYYQWGRKDPFVGFSAQESTPFAQATPVYDIDGKPILPWQTEAASATVTLDYIAATPNSFVTDSYEWLGEDRTRSNTYLWGNPVTDIPGKQYMKSIYDPCPVGYMVPPKEAYRSLTSRSRYNSSDQGRFITCDDDSELFFPLSQYRNHVDGTGKSAAAGYFWTSESWSGPKYRGIEVFFISQSQCICTTNGAAYYAPFGYPVRCVREKE